MVQGGRLRQMQMCPRCSQNNTLTARNCIYCGSPLPSVPLVAKGTILNNRYVVMHILGAGGFGAVYLALDQRLSNRKVAVKELLQTDPAIIRQFENEARILANLSHYALPKVFDQFKEFGTDRYYLVMEYIDGKSVWNIVQQKGFMSPSEAMTIFEPVLDAVGYLHRQNPPVIHRDIKPLNILVTKEHSVYLVDFGIAKVGGAGERTATGARGVSPGFSPPEQYSSSGETDARSDIYSLGATLYFMLTGKVPPEAVERLTGQASLEPVRSVNTAVSPEMEQAIFVAMDLKKEKRFNSVDEFWAGLKGQTMPIQPPSPTLQSIPTTPSPTLPDQPAISPLKQPKPDIMPTPTITPGQPAESDQPSTSTQINMSILIAWLRARALKGRRRMALAASALGIMTGILAAVMMLNNAKPQFRSQSHQSPLVWRTCWDCNGTGNEGACYWCKGKGFKTCSSCEGHGVDPLGIRCTRCGGKGVVVCTDCNGKGIVICKTCEGTGKVWGYLCSWCKGTGKTQEQCSACSGTGRSRLFENVTCFLCEGKGWVVEECDGCRGKGIVKREKCSWCSGEGRFLGETCHSCEGKGWVVEKFW